MRKIILPSVVLCLFICVGHAKAAVCPRVNYNYYPNDLAIVTGNVEGIGRNSIKMYDEEQKRTVRLIYFTGGEDIHQGEYVRVYYHPDSDIVQTIKKMTVLEYKKNTQNLGYITR